MILYDILVNVAFYSGNYRMGFFSLLIIIVAAIDAEIINILIYLLIIRTSRPSKDLKAC